MGIGDTVQYLYLRSNRSNHGQGRRLMRFVLALVLMMVSLSAVPEAGMIGFNTPPGPIGGQGHWYSLRTMKGVDYWEDPAIISDVRYDEETGQYSVSGEPPIAVAIVLHPDFYANREPWRRALDWVRQAEQIFRNSGVALRFVVNHIETRQDLPDGVEAAYNHISGGEYVKYGVDMLIVLMPTYGYDPLCGIASLGRSNYFGGVIRSVSACDPETLAHELGHNFGLFHYGDDRSLIGEVDRVPGGYCITGGATDEEQNCITGTIMSYASNRVPFFANRNFMYKGKPLGSEEADAVEHLNRVKAGRALAYELDQQRSLAPGFEANPEVVFD